MEQRRQTAGFLVAVSTLVMTAAIGIFIYGLTDLKPHQRPWNDAWLDVGAAMTALAACVGIYAVWLWRRPADGEPDRPTDRPDGLNPPTGALPRPAATELFGRENDKAALVRLTTTERLTTITGPPGVGKSRLALEVALATAAAFDHGVFVVELEPIRSPSLVLRLIAERVGVQERAGTSLEDALHRALAERRVLLVLDNCEHVLQAAADIANLLEACPGLRILATSFGPLGLQDERIYPLQPLSVPEAGAADLEDVAATASACLFVDRAIGVRPTFRLTAANAQTVAELCRRVDGLPLALELAAAWMRVLTPSQYLERLEQIERTPQPSAGPEARHATLRNALMASYSLLSPTEQDLFRSLGVFQGGADLVAIEAVAPSCRPIVALLAALIDVHLIKRLDDEVEASRYTLLPPLQRFAAAQLDEHAETAACRTRHARHFAALAAAAEPLLIKAEQMTWIARLELEHDNLRAALDDLIGNGEMVAAAEMATALTRFYYVHGHLTEGRELLERLLDHTGNRLEPWSSARVGAGLFAREQGDFVVGRARLSAAALRYENAEQLAPLAASLYHLGILEYRDRQIETARLLFERSLRYAEDANDVWTVASAYRGLSHVATAESDYNTARAALNESLQHFRTAEDPRGLAISLRFAGEIAIDINARESAGTFLRECLTLLSALDDAWSVNNALLAMARLSALNGNAPRALRLAGAAGALREQIGAVLPRADHARVDGWTAPLQASMPAGRYASLVDEGARMSLQEAVAYALEASAVES